MNTKHTDISSNKNTPELIEATIKQLAKKTGSSKLYCFNWLSDIKNIPATHSIVEIRFKNTRKEFFDNTHNLPLEIGDIVAVESSPGHDIGVVSLVGELVKEQIAKVYGKKIPETFNKIYRKAKTTDIEKWEEAKALEHTTMIRTRQIAKNLKLDMKIGDVEYQGDKTKAIFYYIADERVDFRELIKILADEFKIRVEMKQIGARQEAGRIGGIAPCGRDLCCSSFKTNFVTVSTAAARAQELSLNPHKLAGQCGKLKCCLNYELATYQDARKNFPDTSISLEFEGGVATHTKTDVHKGIMWYFYRKNDVPTFAELSVERIHEIIELNKKGIKPQRLEEEKSNENLVKELDYENVIEEDGLKRFDKKTNYKRKNNKSRNTAKSTKKTNTQKNPNPNPNPKNRSRNKRKTN
ncbi:MAG: hypothetical protein M0R02_03270 [Bacteroidales bacterium]|nr:hypothetical protein [Bacteroidales bacterium]NLK81909.1 hypothetical protein [Bacteroidales bacterium]HPY82346.1 regulatory iron-sulfur-containing complex subunit RicT [Bacteroidales bacterium]